MGTCERCGHQVPDAGTTCPTCGNVFNPRLVCDRCGRRIPAGADSCMFCGYSYASPDAPARPLPGGDVFRRPVPVAFARGDSVSAWPGGAVSQRRFVRSTWRLDDLRLTDPVYLVALSLAAASAAFFWVVNLGVILAGAALLAAAWGYLRSTRHRYRYTGIWVNVLATLIALYGLYAGARTSVFF